MKINSLQYKRLMLKMFVTEQKIRLVYMMLCLFRNEWVKEKSINLSLTLCNLTKPYDMPERQ